MIMPLIMMESARPTGLLPGRAEVYAERADKSFSIGLYAYHDFIKPSIIVKLPALLRRF